MLNLNEEMLHRIHDIELEMLIEVDRICRKSGINYTIIGGTLLGAVRHKGFIPWDDDADVAMLRPEYDKFCDICIKELDNSRFYFQNISITEGYRWGYAKLRRKNTLFLRENQEHMPYEQGIFIDIFPQDSVPNNTVIREIHNFQCFCIRKILWSEVGKYAVSNGLLKVTYTLLSKIPMNLVCKFYKQLIIRDNKSNLVRTLTFPAPKKKYGYKRIWLTETIDINFNGIMLRGIKDYDGWLKWEFGNYMQLPSEEKRKTHPVTALKI